MISSKYYTINGTRVISQDHCKDIGVIFSSDLSWTEHYHSISAKAYQILVLIRQSFSSSLPTRVKKLLFLSLVKSKLTYCQFGFHLTELTSLSDFIVSLDFTDFIVWLWLNWLHCLTSLSVWISFHYKSKLTNRAGQPHGSTSGSHTAVLGGNVVKSNYSNYSPCSQWRHVQYPQSLCTYPS